jgi:hypothetical protein
VSFLAEERPSNLLCFRERDSIIYILDRAACIFADKTPEIVNRKVPGEYMGSTK